MASTIRTKTGNAEELSKTRMIIALDMLLKAVYDLPDIEKRLMKAKQQVLFHQINLSLQTHEIIDQAYTSLLAQLPILRQQENQHG